ncbi:unnamed protein product, partial [Heterotrigona itama]
YTLPFIDNTRKKHAIPSSTRSCDHLLAWELTRAEKAILRIAQRVYLANDVSANPTNQSGSEAQYFKPEGIIRVGSRLKNAPLKFEQTPCLTPKIRHACLLHVGCHISFRLRKILGNRRKTGGQEHITPVHSMFSPEPF